MVKLLYFWLKNPVFQLKNRQKQSKSQNRWCAFGAFSAFDAILGENSLLKRWKYNFPSLKPSKSSIFDWKIPFFSLKTVEITKSLVHLRRVFSWNLRILALNPKISTKNFTFEIPGAPLTRFRVKNRQIALFDWKIPFLSSKNRRNHKIAGAPSARSRLYVFELNKPIFKQKSLKTL